MRWDLRSYGREREWIGEEEIRYEVEVCPLPPRPRLEEAVSVRYGKGNPDRLSDVAYVVAIIAVTYFAQGGSVRTRSGEAFT